MGRIVKLVGVGAIGGLASLALVGDLRADDLGSAPIGRQTKVVVTNLSGDGFVTIDADHYAEPGTRRAIARFDVKDPDVREVDMRISSLCETAGGISTNSNNRDDLRVDGNRKASISLTLPGGHRGCSISFSGSIFANYEDGDFQNSRITITRAILTGDGR